MPITTPRPVKGADIVTLSGGLVPLLEKLNLTKQGFANIAIGVGAAIAAYELYNDIQNRVKEGQRK